MKKTLISLAILTPVLVFANNYKIIIKSDEVNYESGTFYAPTGEITCVTKSPLENTIYKETDFTQSQSNCTEIYRSSDGFEVTKPHEDITINSTGSLVLNTCKEILDNSHSRGTGEYFISYNSSEIKVDCDMTTDDGGWTKWWWHDIGSDTFPTSEDDMLGHNFGDFNVDSKYAYQKLPSYLNKSTTEILAKDGVGTIYRWDFNSSTKTSQSVWNAFSQGIETGATESVNAGAWNPTAISGIFHGTAQDSFMYRMQGGLKGFILDDDNCDCISTLNAGGNMCGATWNSGYGDGIFGFGVDNLYDNACNTPESNKSLFIYFKEE